MTKSRIYLASISACLTWSQILEQSVWVLGNIAGEGSASRDAVLSAGVMKPLGIVRTSFPRFNCSSGLLELAHWLPTSPQNWGMGNLESLRWPTPQARRNHLSC
jgi:hypothetical protein